MKNQPYVQGLRDRIRSILDCPTLSHYEAIGVRYLLKILSTNGRKPLIRQRVGAALELLERRQRRKAAQAIDTPKAPKFSDTASP
jgi:hypothetical protein